MGSLVSGLVRRHIEGPSRRKPTYFHPTVVWQTLQKMSATLCNPVISVRSSEAPSDTFSLGDASPRYECDKIRSESSQKACPKGTPSSAIEGSSCKQSLFDKTAGSYSHILEQVGSPVSPLKRLLTAHIVSLPHSYPTLPGSCHQFYLGNYILMFRKMGVARGAGKDSV